jgi:hypothetical protein
LYVVSASADLLSCELLPVRFVVRTRALKGL